MMVLWKHECTRVFSDRFTIEEDKTWFDGELLSLVEQQLGPEFRKKTEPNPVFVDFMRFQNYHSQNRFSYISLQRRP
jgi:dynein heavy chain